MHDQEFHAAIDGFGEKSSLCSRTVARRMKKLIKDGVPMRDWNVQQVLDWLDYAGLHQHRSLFQRCPVDGELLSKLSSETLKTKVGIRSYGHRQNIMEELDQLKSFISKAAAQGGSSQDAAHPQVISADGLFVSDSVTVKLHAGNEDTVTCGSTEQSTPIARSAPRMMPHGNAKCSKAASCISTLSSLSFGGVN